MLKKTRRHQTAGARPQRPAHRNRLGHRLQRIRQQGWQSRSCARIDGADGMIAQRGARLRLGPAAVRPDFRGRRSNWSTRCGAEGPRPPRHRLLRQRSARAARARRRRSCSSTLRTPTGSISRPIGRTTAQARGFLVRRLRSAGGCRRDEPHLRQRRRWCRCDPTSSGRSATTAALSYWSRRTKPAAT